LFRQLVDVLESLHVLVAKLQKLLALVDLLVVGNRCLWQHGVQQEPFARACHLSSPLSLRLPEVCVDNKTLLPTLLLSLPTPPLGSTVTALTADDFPVVDGGHADRGARGRRTRRQIGGHDGVEAPILS